MTDNDGLETRLEKLITTGFAVLGSKIDDLSNRIDNLGTPPTSGVLLKKLMAGTLSVTHGLDLLRANQGHQSA